MIIKYVSGCTADSLTIDGKESVDMDISDVRTAIKRALDYEDDISQLQEILMNLTEHCGVWENSEYCEQCGDSIDTFSLEIV